MANPAIPTSAAARRYALWLRIGPPLLGTCGVLGFLLTWQAASVTKIVDPRHLPPATEVLERFVTNLAYTQFWVATGHTLRAWLLGLLISAAAGLILGVLIGSNRFLVKATHSTVEFLRPIPAVALIPIAALLFGPRLGSELMIIIYACFWIVLIQVFYGIADIDNVAMDTSRTLGLTFLQRVRYLIFPTLLPFLMTGLRLAATVALVLAISVELIVGTPGLGQEVAMAQINGSAPAIYSLIITSGVLGITINALMRYVERRSLFWHESVRGGRSA
ncbi:Putative aliphatic sulfonates transport permease protein SsuC [Arthrobacter saudimassiliensis]|uniref:Putative aliphatic sulfonates transport permease protein SsuC n=1 Tax=Arthrobacter saudimassiliensis TaxID=1461584 RepID=A0A078MSP5_9MICC|nr:Putative aliphatic sulfonates transport permease protein SsuC [Arthrobacter saudimassiliensis]